MIDLVKTDAVIGFKTGSTFKEIDPNCFASNKKVLNVEVFCSVEVFR